MSELQFEQKINEILSEIINKESLFVKNDFNEFYNKILSNIGIYNIDKFITSFNDDELKQYNNFYKSLEDSFLVTYGVYQVMNGNIDYISKDILLKSEDIERYFTNKLSRIINTTLQVISNNLTREHIIMIMDKLNKYSDIIRDNIFKIINNKEFLINNVSNENFIDYLRKSDVLNNLDIETLKIYLDHKRYEILIYISDEVFSQLSSEYINEIIKNCREIIIRDLSEDKKKYMFESTDLFTVLIYNSGLLEIYYKYMKYISEEKLDLIINYYSLRGIEKCSYILNNIDYVKRIIKSGYDSIFKYLSEEQVDDEILANIDYDEVLINEIFANIDYDEVLINDDNDNLSNLLKCRKIFNAFSQNVSSKWQHYLLEEVGPENITREMVLFCMLNGMNISNEYFLYHKDIYNKVKEYYSRTLDDVKYALECGYKYSNKTIRLSKDEINLFIDYNQPESIYYANDLSFEIIKKATLKGKGYNFYERVIEILACLENFEKNLNELLNVCIENNNIDFCDHVLLNIDFPFIDKRNLCSKLYKDDLLIQQFLKFVNIYGYNLNCKSREDICKYFDEYGPKNKLYDMALFNEKLLKIFNKNYDIMGYYKNDKSILNYINYIIKNGMSTLNLGLNGWKLLIRNKQQVYDFFDEYGPSDKFYDIAIVNVEFFEIFEKNYNILEHYKDDKIIKSYILYQKKIGEERMMFLDHKEEIYMYFDEIGPNNKFYDKFIFGDKQYLSRLIIENDFNRLKEIYDSSTITYLKMRYKYRIIFNFITKENVSIYFDKLGPRPELCIYLYQENDFDKIIIANLEYKNILNEKDSLILDNYKKIDDIELKKVYKEFILENKNIITLDKINDVADVLKKISSSNSMELINLRTEIANQLLLTDDPIGNFNLIEEKFVQNNLPTVGKIFSVFEILHPDFSGFNFSEFSMVSPVLKKKSNKVKEFIVFADLIRITLGSNNRSLKEYLNYIKEGDKLYQILKNNSNYKINEDEKNILVNYIKYIITLYNNTKRGKINPYILNDKNYIETLDELKQLLSMDGNLDYSLSDRVVSMFCHVAGFNTLEEVDAYMHDKIAGADKKNRLKTSINLQPGDLIKGIGDIKYLGNILQNGSVAKEYLGQYATSDLTPLDTDLSMILRRGSTPEECMGGTAAQGYGPIWFVVKNDNRLSFTRRSEVDLNQEIDERTDLTKLETFYTGAVGKGHYGIRTGFASSDIDYIIVESYDKRIGLEIAINGFYIPVFDKLGNRVFSPDDYDKIRKKMQGLSYYDIDKYEVSKNLIIPGVEEMSKKIPDSISDVIKKRQAINSAIKKVLEKFNLDLKDHFDGDLSEGFVELIDTGSTGRFTNMPGDGDFDFMLKLDRKIKDDPEKMNKLKLALLKEFHCDENDMIDSGDFRLKKVKLDNLDVPVDIDITFEVKTDKIAYSTDECLKDRLKNIRKTNPEEYYLIISNILLAKKYLKEFEVYKPDRGDNPQGGLGGVGIENWILQYGGSFYDAAKSFLEAARGKSFEEFQKSYVIWDFGENHLVTRKNIYPHDNFVYNMSESGYNKMKDALEKLLKNINKYGLENIEGYKIK